MNLKYLLVLAFAKLRVQQLFSFDRRLFLFTIQYKLHSLTTHFKSLFKNLQRAIKIDIFDVFKII